MTAKVLINPVIAKCFVIFLMSFRNNAYNFHLTPLTLTPLTPVFSHTPIIKTRKILNSLVV